MLLVRPVLDKEGELLLMGDEFAEFLRLVVACPRFLRESLGTDGRPRGVELPLEELSSSAAFELADRPGGGFIAGPDVTSLGSEGA